MKAAIFKGSGQPLAIEDVPKPKPGPGEILVRVAACGVCHTDLHYLDHGVPTFKKPPLILGHESSGTVEELGDGVANWKKGDRVLLPAVLTCGSCEMCRLGRENVCLNMKMYGNHVDGGFAEFTLAPAKDAIAIPASLPLAETCVVADAASTPYHAVTHRGRVRPGDRVAVFGCGGVGVNTVQFAAATGASVIAVDIDPSKLEIAKGFGAAQVVNAREEKDVVKKLRSLTGGGPDIAFECIGNPVTVKQAIECVRRGGRTVVVGFCDKPVELNAGRTMFFEQEIVGSLGCRPVDYPRILDMAVAGRIRVAELVTGRFPLEQINEAVDTLRGGRGLRNIVVP
ncbi:MAG: zinc-binding dehydrogenase [Planctomycetes bacterium]|nr:zinc-binding dehydrogenase [Planctomycetota bacterium]